MHNVKLIVSYDGTDYFGFQAQQSDVPTIAGELIQSISRIANHPVEIVCAGRTDKGVHAEGQVVNFMTSQPNLKEHNWVRALNSSLPLSIRVTHCEFVSESFSSRFDAVAREYWYSIINTRFPDAIQSRFATHIREHLDTDKLNEYCAEFIGEHDFTAFCSSMDASRVKRRLIYSYKAERHGNLIILKIKGSGFLHNMVRILTGTLVGLHKKEAPASVIQEIILSKDRVKAGKTLPPTGLIFKKAYYNTEEIYH